MFEATDGARGLKWGHSTLSSFLCCLFCGRCQLPGGRTTSVAGLHGKQEQRGLVFKI